MTGWSCDVLKFILYTTTDHEATLKFSNPSLPTVSRRWLEWWNFQSGTVIHPPTPVAERETSCRKLNSSQIKETKHCKGSPCTKYYCGPQVQYFAHMHIAALPSCVSSLLGTFWPFQAFLGYAVCVFLLCQAFFSYAEPFSTLPSIFLPCWSLVSFAKHLSSMLSTTQLFRAFFGHAKHFSALPIISLLCWEVFRLFHAFFRYTGHFFCSAKHF